MEEQEKYLGGVTSKWLARGMIRGYAIHVTNKRIIGVKERRRTFEESGGGLVGFLLERRAEKKDTAEEERLEEDKGEQALEELLKTKDVEINKTDIKWMQLKKPGKIHQGHLRILLKSSQEIQIKIGAPWIFDAVAQLIQSFYPQVLEMED
jgi:hypothetical protein